MPEDTIWTFVETLRRSPELGSAVTLFRQAIADHGFDASAAGVLSTVHDKPGPNFFADWPADWLQLYHTRNFIDHDYLLAVARQRLMPFTWIEAARARALSEGEREALAEANAFGWRDGVAVPVHGPGGYLGLVVAASRERVDDPRVVARIHAMSLYLHERCRELVGSPGPDPGAVLTAREIECLRWVGLGKSDWDIGRILGISHNTAHFHVEQAKRKLGVRTRSQAVAALALGGLM